MQLPEIEALRRRCMALAMLDALMCPEWEYRYYSFNPQWSVTEEMASMRNGHGDDWFLLFDKVGAALKGFTRDSGIAKTDYAQRIQIEVPQSFTAFLFEPAFSMEFATFCYWRNASDSAWSKVSAGIERANVDDGSQASLSLLIGSASAYQEFANDYYEKNISVEVIQAVYDLAPLTERLVTNLNPSLAVVDAGFLAKEIGYPFERALEGN
ncbi:hypothetical protein DUGA2_39370 [Duganella sp. HH101]|nr:hypothetical protein DUGA2_39370 [Duganella sp. HH101]